MPSLKTAGKPCSRLHHRTSIARSDVESDRPPCVYFRIASYIYNRTTFDNNRYPNKLLSEFCANQIQMFFHLLWQASHKSQNAQLDEIFRYAQLETNIESRKQSFNKLHDSKTSVHLATAQISVFPVLILHVWAASKIKAPWVYLLACTGNRCIFDSILILIRPKCVFISDESS